MYKIEFIYKILMYFQSLGYSTEYNRRVINNLDKSLLFVNSGVANNYSRIQRDNKPFITIQQCVRISGKHNDIENIGSSNIHASCFHMLGLFGVDNVTINLENAVRVIYKFLSEFCSITDLTATIHPDYPYKVYNLLEEFGINKTVTSENVWHMNDYVSGICLEFFKDDIELFNIVYIYDKERDIYMIDSGAGVERLHHVMYKTSNIFDFSEYKSLKLASAKNRMRIIDLVTTIDVLVQNKVPYGNSKHSYILKKLLRILMLLLVEEGKIVNSLEFSFAVNVNNIADMVEYEKHMLDKGIHAFKNYVSKRALIHLSKKDVVYLHTTCGVVYELLDYVIKASRLTITYDLIDPEKDISTVSGIGFNKYSIDYFSMNIATIDLLEYDSNLLYSMDEKGEFTIDFIGGKKYYICVKENIFYPHNLGGQSTDIGFIAIRDKKIFKVIKCIKISDKDIYEHNKESVRNEKDLDNIVDRYSSTYILEVICIEDLPKHFYYNYNDANKVIQIVDKDNRDAITRNHTAHHIILQTLKQYIRGDVIQCSSSVTSDRSQITVFTAKDCIVDKKYLNNFLARYLEDDNSVEFSNMRFSDVYNSDIVYLHTAYYPEIVRIVTVNNSNSALVSKEICAGFHVGNTRSIKSIVIDEVFIVNPFITKYYFKAS